MGAFLVKLFFVAPSLQIFWSSSIFQTNLTLIKDRLETNYYRSKANLQWEIDFLHSNCIKFNGETDEESNGLFSLSKALTAGLYEIIAMDHNNFFTFRKRHLFYPDFSQSYL